MHQYQELWTRLNLRMLALRGAFGESADGKSSRDNFEDFLEANEYELALHILCDFLLEHEPAVVTESMLNEISDLHTMMNLNDNCERSIRQKLNE